MPKVTEAHLEARRRHILEAAARCFSRNGFHGTTIHAICDEAQLSTGGVYRYFSSKDEIVAAIAELGRQATREILEEGRGADTATRSLVQMMSTSLDLVHSAEVEVSNRLSLLLWGEALHTSQIKELLLDALSNLAQPFAAEVQRGQERREIASGLEPASAGRVLAALGIGFTVLAAIDPQPHTASTEVIAALLTGEFAEGGNPQ
jgi:AcrR family transcriptional regulator